MENSINGRKLNTIDEMDFNFEADLKSAYKPVDELFDTLMDDDGYEDYFQTTDNNE